LVLSDFHLPLRSITCGSIPKEKASVVPPALGECKAYKFGFRPAHFSKVLKDEYAAE